MKLPSARRSNRVERYETIIIGAGQTGLATAHHLAKRDVDFLILEGGARVGDTWRNRWDSLRLFTPAGYSGLPGMPFPAPPHHLPDKDEVADYLERYAERFDLPIRLNTHVKSLDWDGQRYLIDTGAIRYEADNVVVASGPFQTPQIPAIAAELSPAIRQMHSSQYHNPFELGEGRVLVVGAGSSGTLIALELSRFRHVFLAGKSTGHTPRTFLGRDIFFWLWPMLHGVTTGHALGRHLRDRPARGDVVIGITKRELASSHVKRVGRVTGARDGLPVCDGSPLDVQTIIWSTGFAPEFSWIKVPMPTVNGRPTTMRGVVRESPGLYFVGQRFQHRLTSALLGGVGDDAGYIAEQIWALR